MTEKNNGTITAAAREIGEAQVGLESLSRAGRNPNLKGVVHEVAVKNMYNASPERLVDGTRAILSKSSTAVRDDLLIMKNSNVVGRMQLKDTAQSIQNTVSQVKNGHYIGTALKGTKETVAAYNSAVEKAVSNGAKITQKMTSTGISSSDTARIAAKTLGSSAGKITAGSLGSLAASSGAVGAVVSGGIEAVSSTVKLVNGEIDGGEFVANVTKETIGGGLSAAGGSVAATAVATGTATLLAATTAPAWIPAAVGLGAAVAIGSAIKGAWDSFFD